MNILNLLLVFITFVSVKSQEVYDRYSGKQIYNLQRQCSIDVKPCTPHEGRRVDGTCNNFKHPSRGSAGGPFLRLLKPDYGNSGGIRRSSHDKPLPSARLVRTAILTDGRVADTKTFNSAASRFLSFIANDVTVISGPLDYLRNRTYCCTYKGHSDPRCEPIPVPPNDPYLRVNDIQCMNFSRLETFQDIGCLTKEKDPEQINYQTPLLDLSIVYGVNDEALKSIRLFEHGLLREERRKGRYMPLNETRDICFQNKSPNPVCYKFGFSEAGNYDLLTSIITIFFYRNHNRIARDLHELNPCWQDDQLFQVARQINIGTAANIFMYELLPHLIGYKNMLHNGLISEDVTFLTQYDEDTEPLVYAEFEIAIRFFHTFRDGQIKRYDENHHYIGEFSFSDTLFRQELLEEETNIEEIIRGLFYQTAARIDDIIDPDVSEKFYSQTLKAHDLAAVNIQRGRDVGLPGYNHYRPLCGLKPAKKFEDFLDVISEEKVYALKHLYHNVEDVDFLVGIMSEEFISGLFVGPTLLCILVKQLEVLRFSDKFWFERGDQYNSFSLAQLREIRKTNMARFACDNADGIKFIQPHALLNVGRGNEHVPCSHIPEPDLTKWKDDSCQGYDLHSNADDEEQCHIDHELDRNGVRVLFPKTQRPHTEDFKKNLNYFSSFNG